MPKAESRPAGGFGGWLGDGILCCAVLCYCCAVLLLCCVTSGVGLCRAKGRWW